MSFEELPSVIVTSTKDSGSSSSSSLSSPTKIELSPVQSTSLLTALWRDLETNSTNKPLICDRQANVLLSNLLPSKMKEEWLKSPLKSVLVDALAVRTRVIDDWLLTSSKQWKSSNQTEQRQVVNLGAGMCSRPYRLNFPTNGNRHIKWFEVDSDVDVLYAKRSVLENTGGFSPMKDVDIIQLSGDLCKIEQLNHTLDGAGHDPSIPTDWIIEGVLEYLDPKRHYDIFQFAQERSAKDSRIMFQVFEPIGLDYMKSKGVTTIPYQELVSVDVVVETLVSCGWAGDSVNIRQEKEFVDEYGRSPTLPGFCLVDASF